MSASLPEEIQKEYPEVYGYIVQTETKKKVVIRGIKLEIKEYVTTNGTGGIRVSLIDNTSSLFLRFNEYLASIADERLVDEKAIGMWSFTTICSVDPGLEDNVGFYIYQNHIVFNEEEGSKSPLERLSFFIEYYKKKFEIKTLIKENGFQELDILERKTI